MTDEALRKAADDWQWGQWAVVLTPLGIGVPTLAVAQAVTDWLRERAEGDGS